MSRRKGEAIDGLLLLDKPSGMTSNRALQSVRRLLNAKKAGHTGSLDPAATGMLPLCFGEATKVCAYLLNADKTYRVTARLGAATSTGDADGGETVATADVPDQSFEEWDAILQGFKGESTQVPPMYSALKKDGRRLYELARKGETVDREPRPIRVDEITLLEAAGSRLVFRVTCSKGTYIRVLVEDIAKAAGTVAHTARLHREAVADFRVEDMLDLSTVEASIEVDRTAFVARLLPPDKALLGLPQVAVPVEEGPKFSGGQALEAPEEAVDGPLRVYTEDGQFLGVGELSDQRQLCPRRVFKTS